MTANAKEFERSELYSEELGISLRKHSDRELFKWFLASQLFGRRISEDIAKKTYRSFERYELVTPKRILLAGWDFLVNPVMREGHYVRYDESTSTQILQNCRHLLDDYGGSLKRLHDTAADARDLQKKLQSFKGFGPTTTNIFLREMRPYWHKADPPPSSRVRRLARQMKVDLDHYDRHSLRFARVEAGLMRHRKQA